MEIGYVLFKIKPGYKKAFIKKVRKIANVKETRLVIGIFDAIAKIEAESIEDLESIYYNKLDKLSGVIDSHLYIVACPRTRK